MLSAEDHIWRVSGDPTEAAMLVFAQKLGIHKDVLEKEFPQITEIPFDYRLKYHAVVHGNDTKKILTVVGAPEVILNLSTTMWRDGQNKKLDAAEKEALEKTFIKLSQEGLRVIAFAQTEHVPHPLAPETIGGLTFVGFYGMKDALRPEVADALARATNANIRVVMITGDHKITAQAIAKEAGIYRDGDSVLTGEDVDSLSETELSEKLATTSVFARVNPDHKLTIIKAFRARGEIIAMTGDGVNDAPSLVAADLGVAMGSIGTEVAKEASDIVLLDDNFGSIVSAVEEGRSIYKTIKKVILYLFSTSLGEVLTITGALFLGVPLPILAAQIIWLNFVTDGFLDVSLAMEPKEKGLLRDNFERPKKYLVDRKMAQRMILMALPMAIGTLYLFTNNYQEDITKAWTISLSLLAAFQWFNAWNCRSEEKSIFQMNPFSNKFLIGATALVITLQMFAVYNPFMQKFLRTTALDLSDWMIIIPIAASIVLVEEVRKLLHRRQKRSSRFLAV
jgi:Ca2+-transporting ATPase